MLRQERWQAAGKLICFGAQLEAMLRQERGDASTDELGSRSLVQQNIELRRKLEEEHSNYKRKLQTYQDGQTKQAQLVQKLQAKVSML